MVPLLLLLMLWGGSLQEHPGYELQVQESVKVQEGLCIHVPCSFSYPWSSWYSSSKLYTYWYQNGDDTNLDVPVVTNKPNIPVKSRTKNRFFLADPSNNSCSLNIRDARISDTGIYFFRVQRGNAVKYNYRGKKLNLQVTALTEKPNIHFLKPLESGHLAQLTCKLPGSCEGGGLLTFSWTAAAIDLLNLHSLPSPVLTFIPRPWHHGTNLTCQVKLQKSAATTQRTIWLNVLYAPQNLNIGISFRNVTALKILQTTSLPILAGEALRLLCVADSNPPAELSWFRESSALNTTPISSTEILELPHVGPAEEGEFTCQAWHPLGSQNISLRLSVVYAPQLLGPSCSWEVKGLSCSCSSRAQPAPSLSWRLGEGLLARNHSNTSYTVTSSSAGPWANSSLSLSTGLSTGLRLSCEARNVHGTQTATILLLPGRSLSLAGGVPAALGGAGATALLSLCLCLIFFCTVKARRKQAAGRTKVMTNEDPVMGTVTWGFKQKPQEVRTPGHESFTGNSPASEEQQELHYATLRFHGMKPKEPQDQEATSSPEYSEINITSQ